MRADPTLVKRVGRVIAFALIGAAIAATAARVNDQEAAIPPTPAAQVVDPLGAELERCRKIARPEDVDDACRIVWAEVRQHFFTPDHAGEARP
jgi:conjugative transfer region protein TrbK